MKRSALFLFLPFFLPFFLLPPAHAVVPDHFTTLEGAPPPHHHSKGKELVFFWATWCGSCAQKLKEDLPAMEESEDVAVITVNIDQNPERVLHFVKKRGITLPVWRDTQKVWQQKLKVEAVPHWALFQKSPSQENEWELLHTEVGFDREKIRDLIRKGKK